MKRRIPYAVANYEKIVRDHYYFVDKTRFIHERLLQNPSLCPLEAGHSEGFCKV